MARDDELTMIVRLRNQRKFAADLKRAAHNVREFVRESEEGDKKQRKWNASLNAFHGVLGIVKPLALVAAIGALVQVLGAAAAATGALTATLLPLGSALIALPGVFLAAKQAMGVWKLATLGVMDAVGGLNDTLDPEKLAKLTPAAQQLAIALDNMKRPLVALQSVAQEQLFPYLLDALDELRPLLRGLEPIVRLTADAMGSVALAGAQMLAALGPELHTMAALNANVIEDLGMAGVALAQALVLVLNAAEPLLLWMTASLRGWTEHLAMWAATEEGASSLSSAFARTQQIMEAWWAVIRPFGEALRNIFLAALPTGLALLDVMARSSEEFAAWTGSVQGQHALRTFFEDALPAMVEIGRLIGAIVVGFFKLAATPGLAGMIEQVRTELLPALGDLMEVATEKAPMLIDALTNVSRLAAELGEHADPLWMVVGAISTLAGGVATLIDNNPALGTFVSLIAGFAGILSTMGLVAFISNLAGIGRGFAILKFLCGGVNPLLFIMRGVLWGIAVVAGILGIPFEAAALLIIGAIAAVIAIGYLLAANWDWLKEKAKEVFGWIAKKIHSVIDGAKDLASYLNPAAYMPGGEHGGGGNGIPFLADGGTVSGSGSWVTGEAGPELNTLSGNRVRVQPLARNSSVSPIGFGALGRDDRPIHTTVAIDGEVVAKAVHRRARNKEARR